MQVYSFLRLRVMNSPSAVVILSARAMVVPSGITWKVNGIRNVRDVSDASTNAVSESTYKSRCTDIRRWSGLDGSGSMKEASNPHTFPFGASEACPASLNSTHAKDVNGVSAELPSSFTQASSVSREPLKRAPMEFSVVKTNTYIVVDAGS